MNNFGSRTFARYCRLYFGGSTACDRADPEQADCQGQARMSYRDLPPDARPVIEPVRRRLGIDLIREASDERVANHGEWVRKSKRSRGGLERRDVQQNYCTMRVLYFHSGPRFSYLPDLSRQTGSAPKTEAVMIEEQAMPQLQYVRGQE